MRLRRVQFIWKIREALDSLIWDWMIILFISGRSVMRLRRVQLIWKIREAIAKSSFYFMKDLDVIFEVQVERSFNHLEWSRLSISGLINPDAILAQDWSILSIFSSHHSHPGFFRGGGWSPTLSDFHWFMDGAVCAEAEPSDRGCCCAWSTRDESSCCQHIRDVGHCRRCVIRATDSSRDFLTVPFESGSISTDPVGFALGFLICDWADSLLTFSIERIHCSLCILWFDRCYPGRSTSDRSCTPNYPRLSGSKQRGPLHWGGAHVFTCALHELDWFTYLRSGRLG